MPSIWDIIVNNFIVFVMIFARVAGIFTFNPIFGRNNVPNTVKVGASFALAIVMTANTTQTYVLGGTFTLAWDVLKELSIGFVLGFFINIMLTVFLYAGEMIDMQVGLGMAKVMDPSSGVSMPIFTTFYYYWFLLYFFLIGGHLSYINLFAVSFEAIPIGFKTLNIDVAYVLVSYFTEVMKLGVRFALPIIICEMMVESAIGVLMKAVPTIHVFVVNIQVKLMVGLVLIALLAPSMSNFIGEVMDVMLTGLYNMMPTIGSA